MNERTPARRSPATRRGFTLVELVVACSISTILIMAVSSVIVVATRALPDSGPAAGSLVAARVIEQMTADLACAQSILSADASSIELTVPDRDGDGSPETIAYVWKAVAGGTLVRKYNAYESTLIESLPALTLAYTTDKVGPAPVPTATTSAESLLLDTGAATGSISTTPSISAAQAFRPALAANATAWSISKVEVHLASSGTTTDRLLAELYTAALTGAPSGSARSQVNINESSLPTTATFFSIGMPALNNISPSEGISLVLRQASGTGASARVGTNSGLGSALGLDSAGTRVMSTALLGVWTPDLTRTLAVRFYGTVTTVATPPDTRPLEVRAVEILVTPPGNTGQRLRTAVVIPARPLKP